MKIFSAEQIRQIDAYTIANEPVKSIDLMERAAVALYDWFSMNIDRGSRICIVTGPGNNGGDGLALARLLYENGYIPEVINIRFGDKVTEDWAINRNRLGETKGIKFTDISTGDDFPFFYQDDIVVDAIFGTGLTRPAAGLPGEVIKKINDSDARIISIDIPSGMFSEDNSSNDYGYIIKADVTLSFQFPKLSFLFPENGEYTGAFHILPIGLHAKIIREMETNISLVSSSLIGSIIKRRGKFDHKGRFGHGLMIAGSCGKAGAAVLSTLAALRTGIGLITAHVPKPVGDIIHASVPEAMVQCDQSDVLVSEVYNLEKYDAVGIGPGIGTKPNTRKALRKLIDEWKGPMVIDADGLNIIGEEKDLLQKLSPNTILTPHPGEFARLAGDFSNGYARLNAQIKLSKETGSVILLKGAFTSISVPDGRLWFNTTGNPGMATAGSGDVLTGMILGMLSRGYNTVDAAIAAVYLHGLAGDIAAGVTGQESLIASDIINNIGNAFKKTEIT
ncbi:MAG TPA: NAD(P)H-hydrate dehydratase [Bacteroidales bacterium]|nr:NAD(P)H-hydrate dehydratase [Bacteroidales bacterium]